MTNEVKTGVELIAAERARQVEVEGWTPEHDDQHWTGELAMAAALYAAPQELYARGVDHRGYPVFYDPWPWKKQVDDGLGDFPCHREVNAWDKRAKHDRLRALVIAGALIAAEIDRLRRQNGVTGVAEARKA